MTMQAIRQVWNRQPPASVGIDFSHPLAHGLVFAGPDVAGANMVVPSALVGPGTIRSTATLNAATEKGRGITNVDNDNGGLEWTNEQVFSGDTGFTILCYGNPTAEASVSTMFGMSEAGAGRGGGLFANADENGGSSSGEYAFLLANTASNITSAASGGGIDGDWHVFVGQGTPGSTNNVALWYDGTTVTPGGTTTTGDTSGWINTAMSTGLWHTGEDTADGDPIGSVVLTLCWTRLLSSAEVTLISRNVWQIFKPHEIFIPNPRDRRLVVF
jgi:hypothetical protein